MANEKNIRIGDVLLQAGYINQNELDEALEYQKNNKGIRLGEALIKLGFITEHQQLEALSARLGQRYVKIDRIMVQTEAVAMIPVQLAKKYHLLAVQYQDNNLTIVLNDPLDYYGIEDIRQTTGMNLEIWLTELLPLNQAIEYYYSEIEAKKAASSANEMAREREQALEVDADEGDSDAPVIKLLDNLLARAFSMNASDIHIEPFEEKTFTQYFMPYKEVGQVKNASKEAAVSLSAANDAATGKKTAKIIVYATAVYEKARIILTGKDGVLCDESAMISPVDIFEKSVVLPDDTQEEDLKVEVCADGRSLIAYQPEKEEIPKLPDPAKAADEPSKIMTNEELYLTGQHIEK